MGGDEAGRKEVSQRLRAVWSDPGLWAWTLLTLAASPLAILRKIRRRRHPYEYDPRRWFIPRLDPVPEGGPHAVFVAASYGELLLVKLAADELLARRPDVRITYCVRDDATLEHVRNKEAGRGAAIWPFDFLYPVSRWLGVHRPDLLVFSERFRFTVFSRAAKAFGARVALINGRTRARRGAYYQLAAPFYRWVFGAFDLMCFQSEAYRRDAEPFANKTRLLATGDLKIDLRRKELDPDRARRLEAWLSQRGSLPLVAAGSTDYRIEDEFVLDAYRLLRQKKECRLLLAPRLLNRTEEVLGTIAEKGLTHSARSLEEGDADVYVLDTLGELAHAYRHCEAAYVGGALVGNGHNIIEPLEWGIPVSYGMNRGYFEQAQLLAEEAGLGTRLSTPEALAEFWSEALERPDLRPDRLRRARAMLDAHRGALTRTVDALAALLPPPGILAGAEAPSRSSHAS